MWYNLTGQSKVGVFMEDGGRMVWRRQLGGPCLQQALWYEGEERKQPQKQLQGKQQPQMHLICVQDHSRST